MTIRHPGRWFVGAVLLYLATMWFVARTFDATASARALWLTYVIASTISLLILLRRRGAQPSILSIVSTVAAAGTGAWVLGLDVRWWVRWLLLGIVAAPVMSMANAAYRADVRRAQRKRDAHAAMVAQTVRAGAPVEPYALYLRPFVSTDRLIAQALPSEFEPMDVPVHLDAETLLARSLRSIVPLIGLGRSGEVDEGAARITTGDDEWRETVQALARHASFITMVPLARPSTTWELTWLADAGLLGKILFLMPESPYEAPTGVWRSKETGDRVFPTGVRHFNADVHMLDMGREWTEAIRVARELNIDLPFLAPVGALFTLDPETRTTKDIVPLGLSTLSRPLRYLRAILRQFGFLPALKPVPVDFETTFVDAVWLGGSTLEFALAKAAEGMVVWNNAVVATRLLQRAVDEGQPNSRFVKGYLNSLPAWADHLVSRGELGAAHRHADFARALRDDGRLAPLVTSEVLRKLDEIVVTSH